MIEKITKFWDSLPGEAKISVYYILASGLNELANVLLSTQPINFDTVVRIWVANVSLYFVTKMKERSPLIREKITSIK